MPAPNDYTSDYNASTGITLDTGANVASIADNSANNYHKTQATSANQPTVAIVDGIDAVFFDQSTSFSGSGQYLTGTSTWLDHFGSGDFTAATRVRFSTNPYSDESGGPPQANAIIGAATGMGAAIGARRHSTLGNQVGLAVFNTSFANQLHYAPAPALDTWADIVVRKNGTSISIDVRPIDGSTTKTMSTFSGTMFTEASAIHFGRNGDAAGAWWEGYLAKARTYNYALTDIEVEDLFDEWDGGAAPASPYWPASFLEYGLS